MADDVVKEPETDVAEAVVVEPVVTGPCMLVEGHDGAAAHRMSVSAEVGTLLENKARSVTVDGQVYEVCAEHKGVWVYRAMRF